MVGVELYFEVDASEECAGSSRPVDKARIAVHTLVDVALEMVKQVLYTCVDFQGIVLIERNIIAEFHVPLEEDWCFYLFILWYISCKVLHEHTASDLAVGDNVEMLERLNIAEEVAIVVRGAEHATLRGDIGILAPLQWFDITAMVVGVPRLESEQVTIADFGFYIQSRYTCTARVGARQE